MQPDNFSLVVTKSRLAKGLLAIPKKHAYLFPPRKTEIKLVFDDAESIELKSYVPDDKRVKERRIFGLGRWFAHRDVKPGDRLTITVIDRQKQVYRITLDRHIRTRRERTAREALKRAPNDEVAFEQLQVLAKITKKDERRAAKEALLEVARESVYRGRSRAETSRTGQHQTEAPAVRVLLRELHQGKCQICSFTFAKRKGDPYFEVHHLEPDVGDHPANLLVLCANCHAQFEHANVGGFERVGGWVVAVTINGKRHTVRQPLRTEPLANIDAILKLFILACAGFSTMPSSA